MENEGLFALLVLKVILRQLHCFWQQIKGINNLH